MVTENLRRKEKKETRSRNVDLAPYECFLSEKCISAHQTLDLFFYLLRLVAGGRAE